MEHIITSSPFPVLDGGLPMWATSFKNDDCCLDRLHDLLLLAKPHRRAHAACTVSAWTHGRQQQHGHPKDSEEEMDMAPQGTYPSESSERYQNMLKKKCSKGLEFLHSTTKGDPPWVVAQQAVLQKAPLIKGSPRIRRGEFWSSECDLRVTGNENSLHPCTSLGAVDESHYDGQLNEVVQAVESLYQQGIRISTRTFFHLVQRYFKEKDLLSGKELHCLVLESGSESDTFFWSQLIEIFASFDTMSEVNQIFNTAYIPNANTWSAIISAHAKLGQNEKAIILYHRMQDLCVQPDIHIFVVVLKASAVSAATAEGKLIHAQIILSGFESDIIVGNALVDFYAKCLYLQDARIVFDRLTNRDVATWSAMITGYCQIGFGKEAVQLFEQMQQLGMKPNKVNYISILRACSCGATLEEGKLIHSHMTESGFEVNTYVGNILINMYNKNGNLKEARKVFDTLPNRDVVSWNAMIAGNLQHCHYSEALQLFQQMLEEDLPPNNVTFVCVLKACSAIGHLEQGKQIHCHIILNGFESVVSVGTTLIDMYAKCGSLHDACPIFDKLPERDVITYSVLIAGYSKHGHSEGALQVFQSMKQEGMKPDRVTCVCILKACSETAAVDQGKHIHSDVIELGLESDLAVGSALIDMYAKCASLGDAHLVFGRLQKRDVVTWSVLISGYTEHGLGHEALQLFQDMQDEGLEPDRVTFICTLKACCIIEGTLGNGQHVHFNIIERGLASDLSVGSALIDMYSKSGRIKEAHMVFDRLPNQDIVTWSALIAGYVQHGLIEEALHLFQLMQRDGMKPNQVTFTCILKACSSISALDEGKQLHTQATLSGFELDPFVANTLIDMYGKCGNVQDACTIFERLPVRDLVTWNAMIAGYAKNEHGHEALQMFRQMLQQGMKPDKVTIVFILKACSGMAALQQGKQIHAIIIENGLQSDVFIGSALIDMFSKCGSLQDACLVFDKWPKRDVVTWSAIIAGYVQHGEHRVAFQYFEDMQRVGLKPNDVTFLSLLSACSHMCLLDEGCSNFKSMREKYGIAPIPEHYNCMADLLSRAGHIDEAEDLLDTVPFRHNLAGWMSLLGSCKMHGNVQLGRRCFNYIVGIDCGNAAVHVLMANLYVQAGMWEDAQKIEELRRCANAWKKPAKAFIEIDSEVHSFIVGDKSHPQSENIYKKLKSLVMQMRKEGYIPKLDTPDSNQDEDNDGILCGHCEKLAIAFGLITTPQGTTIRVTKNLRVCAECHLAAKMISKIELREIIVTDSYCIHHFKDGACSCKD